MSDSGDSSGILTTLPRTPSLNGIGSGASFDSLKGDTRFETGPLIGKGGMGEVFSATDVRLKRQMAVKRATSTSAQDLERFVREARVQGQLQHPSIVPVHELGLTPEGVPYFTMKRVNGVTLTEVMDQLKAGEPEATKKYTRRRLLGAFQQVMQAVEFAHSQGVLHRDLKPANVMLGDFGEVYVLDWGLAKPLTGDDTVPLSPALLDGAVVGATPTVAGSLLGTPGYMSPELVVGKPASVQSDVFALGSMLFELLAQERLVPGDTVMTILVATRDGFEPSVLRRHPNLELAPELDRVVQRACARELNERFPSVRAFYDALEAVLAGERDVELRHEMSQKHAATAAAALTELHDGKLTEASRTRALQEIGRSMMLDPKNGSAFATLLELMQTPLTETPAEVKEAMEYSSVRASRTAARSSAIGLVLMVLFVPWFVMMGSPDWLGLGALLALMTVAAGGSWAVAGMDKPNPALLAGAMVTFMIAGATANLCWVPFLVATPTIIVATLMYVSLLPRRLAVLTIVLALLALSAPYLAWWLGLSGAPVLLEDGKLVIVPRMLNLAQGSTHALVLDAMLSATIVGAITALVLRNTLQRAQEKIATQVWNLRQLLPPEAAREVKLEGTAADPRCAMQDFFDNKRLPGLATAAHQALHGP
jgi:eukaryotic-like serine/threonine-protein kinase